MQHDLKKMFGGIDIYVFDQISRGRFDGVKKVLDVGCGSGRNLVYLSNQGVDVYGVDQSSEAIGKFRRNLPKVPAKNVSISDADNLPFATESFGAVQVSRFATALCTAISTFMPLSYRIIT